MKIISVLLTIVIGLSALPGNAQQGAPQGVKWTYTARKISGDTYDLHLTARVRSPWHLYSQHIESGGPIPTNIRFKTDSLVTLLGAVLEKGTPVTMHEQVFNINVIYFTDSVDFVQRVKLKNPTSADGKPDTAIVRRGGPGEPKPWVSGTIEFMICTEEQCLPPTTVSFRLVLD